MAKKRRLKRRKAPREQPPQSHSHTVSSDDSNAIQSGRPSSEGTTSEHATSDGAQTSMTSIMDTDEGVSEIEVDDDDEGQAASLYPVSHYPRPSSAHRTEMPYPSEPPIDASDMFVSARSFFFAAVSADISAL